VVEKASGATEDRVLRVAGRTFSPAELSCVAEIVATGVGASRTQLMVRVCERLAWRAKHGPDKEIFPQEHRPGEAGQTAFTWATELGITIQGEPSRLGADGGGTGAGAVRFALLVHDGDRGLLPERGVSEDQVRVLARLVPKRAVRLDRGRAGGVTGAAKPNEPG
jgi:hypothetical protein